MAETLSITADMAELARVAAWAEAMAERWALPGPTAFGLGLCLEEAVSNIIRHGFAGVPAGDRRIALALAHGADALTLTIEDHGTAFDPLARAAPALPGSVEQARVGGMGIHLMRRFARSIEYERRGDANRLTIRLDLAPPQAGR